MNVKSLIGCFPKECIRFNAAIHFALISLGSSSKYNYSWTLPLGVLNLCPLTSWKHWLGLVRFDASRGQFSFINCVSAGDVKCG
jgi:hypothetical protein